VNFNIKSNIDIGITMKRIKRNCFFETNERFYWYYTLQFKIQLQSYCKKTCAFSLATFVFRPVGI